MKRITLTLAIVAFCCASAGAQKKIPDVHKTFNEQGYRRTEIILPQVKGYNCYKADFHVHTIYSDGELTPRQRVREAWYDGLDILAITDHLEARNYEKYMLKVLAPHNPGGVAHKYYHAGSVRLMEDGTDPGIRSDHNAAFDEAVQHLQKEAYPILLIKGSEISREPKSQGHFNALFIKDIPAIYNIDTKETFRNVHKQGGIVIHNHPAYRRNTTEKSEWQAEVYKEGLIDGIEIVNGVSFYPKMIRRAKEENLAMIGGTDTHRPTTGYYRDMGFYRTMTFVLAKECSEKAIKDAILKRRTIVYSGGELMGEEKWLNAFVNAAVDCRLVSTTGGKKNDSHIYNLTNNSSIAIRLRRGNTIYELLPFRSTTVSYSKSKEGEYGTPTFTVENMWHIDYQHPKVTLEID